ncbi:MAG: hypothetical protein K2X77_16310 [Candidatus Obscuribacterales bacterium]|jgi:hypothetical protein|nr:hypothetical protein [Candidatus Obscuribacterales bacterium]
MAKQKANTQGKKRTAAASQQRGKSAGHAVLASTGTSAFNYYSDNVRERKAAASAVRRASKKASSKKRAH